MGVVPIYLDNNSTTPLDPRVLTAMLPTLSDHFGNPSSATHSFGWYAEELVTIAREQVATLIGAHPAEILFTSGATEANSLAIGGLVKGLRRKQPQRPVRIVTVTTEHRAVLDLLYDLQQDGAEIVALPVEHDGHLQPERLREALTPETTLVSIMLANNEIGTVHDLAALAKIAQAAGVPIHSDATQAAGKVPIDVNTLGVDLLSLSAHKMYGPKGVGALWVRKRSPKLPLAALQLGGGQERGLRAGTLNVPGIVGFGKAAALATAELHSDATRMQGLSEQFISRLQQRPGHISINGPLKGRLPGNINVAFHGVASARLIGALNAQLAFSATSACSSRSKSPSHVLQAIGLSAERQQESVRFGFGRFTTAEEIGAAADALAATVKSIREETR